MVESSEAGPRSAAVTIRKIRPTDVDAVCAVMGRAFDDDPFMNYLVKQDAKRSDRIRALMRLGLTKLTFPFGETYMAEGLEGAAFWNPPDGRPHGLLNDLKLLPAMSRIAGLRGLTKAVVALDLMEKKHPKTPSHYYLLAIGVEPALQGRGIGTQLMAPILARCDEQGVPAYLESTKEQNLPLYERNGFEVVEQLNLPKGGPPLWRMWRDPQ